MGTSSYSPYDLSGALGALQNQMNAQLNSIGGAPQSSSNSPGLSFGDILNAFAGYMNPMNAIPGSGAQTGGKGGAAIDFTRISAGIVGIILIGAGVFSFRSTQIVVTQAAKTAVKAGKTAAEVSA